MVAEQVDFGKKILQVQDEISLVKKTLQTGGKHYGMEGQLLSEYLLQLTKQECSLLEIVARAFSDEGEGGGGAGPQPPFPGGVLPPAVGYPGTGSQPCVTAPSAPLTSMNPAKPLEGAPAIATESVPSVLEHLRYLTDAYTSDIELKRKCVYKGLKILCGLVYKTQHAKAALEKGVISLLEVLMRSGDPGSDVGDAMLAGLVAGCVCNLAYDAESCEQFGSVAGVTLLISILNAMSMFPTQGYLHGKGQEAFARILMETGAGSGVDQPPTPTPSSSSSQLENSDPRVLPANCSRVFLFVRVLVLARGRVPLQSLTSAENASKSAIPAAQEEQFAHWPLIQTLLQNEALSLEELATEVVGNLKQASTPPRWFELVFSGVCGLVSAICGVQSMPQPDGREDNSVQYGFEFSALLRKHGLAELMLQDVMMKKPMTQVGARASIEAVARIISTSMDGLMQFVKLGGVHCFQNLMGLHQGDKILLARSIRALASGMDWPEAVQQEANFDHAQLVLKTHNAVSHHMSDPWVLCAGFEGFYKFLPYLDSEKDASTIYKVEALVKEVLGRYGEDVKLKAWGSRILDMIQM